MEDGFTERALLSISVRCGRVDVYIANAAACGGPAAFLDASCGAVLISGPGDTRCRGAKICR